MRKKNLFYKEQKKAYNQNIESKKELINRSSEILETEDWNERVQEMKVIQKQWKTVGFVPRKLDNKLWKEFSDIQKIYFDRLKSGYQKLSPEQETLLKEKNVYLEKVKTLDFTADPEKLKKEYFDHWETWNQMGNLVGNNEVKMNQNFSKTLLSKVKSVGIEKKELGQVIAELNTTILENDPVRLEKDFQNVRSELSSLKAELTQLENNLEFFSNSSSENPLFKNVEKQIQDCQKKIDKTKKEYVALKQIKNSQEKLAKAAKEEENENMQDQEAPEED
jgi:K+/H+ antiporter YhaU regulatory subunit KhtT